MKIVLKSLWRKKRGDTWSKIQLGDYANKSGVYIHHSNQKILYVGKTTTGKWGNFGERLRREFQYTSSQNVHLHQLLASQKNPIYTYFIDIERIEIMIGSDTPPELSRETKVLIIERVLIDLYKPEGNKK